tara:strand:- start:3775 stop:4731 length:957 start_codon:yes stop_codon:yes gene_type:complete
LKGRSMERNMPLHIDYRPETLDEIVGNKFTVKGLRTILDRDKKEIPHSFLFHGASGCGKTTFARIISKELKCKNNNYIEINAGNNRGIETARNILKNIQYKPMGGGVRVILLDEVHATTKDFQNALLKSLEDTPPHTYFILCTTNPKKLLNTVISRCTMFEVKKLTDSLLTGLIKTVIVQERKEVAREMLEQIVKKACGSPRQALINLDKVIDLTPKDGMRVIQTFKTQEESVLELCRALLNRSEWNKVCKILKGIEEEPETVRWSVLGYMNGTLLRNKTEYGSQSLDKQAAIVLDMFQYPFFDSGKAGLTLACFKVQ